MQQALLMRTTDIMQIGKKSGLVSLDQWGRGNGLFNCGSGTSLLFASKSPRNDLCL